MGIDSGDRPREPKGKETEMNVHTTIAEKVVTPATLAAFSLSTARKVVKYSKKQRTEVRKFSDDDIPALRRTIAIAFERLHLVNVNTNAACHLRLTTATQLTLAENRYGWNYAGDSIRVEGTLHVDSDEGYGQHFRPSFGAAVIRLKVDFMR